MQVNNRKLTNFINDFQTLLDDRLLMEAAKIFRDLLVDNVKRKLKVSGKGLSSTKNWEIKRSKKHKLTITASNAIKDYAGIQDSGGYITVTDKMRKQMWALYYSTGNDLYKAIALTKESRLKIPASNYSDINTGEYMRKLEHQLNKIMNK